MDLPFKATLNSETETKKIAADFSEIIKEGDVICLYGDLGSGKTFFVKSVCEKFGIFDVNSPTFAIVNEYSGNIKVYHFDFYRLKNSGELMDIGFYEYLNDKDAVSFIEWSEKFPEILPQNRIEIYLKFVDELKREIEIRKT